MEVPVFEFSHIGVKGESREESARFLQFLEMVLGFQDTVKMPTSHFIADNRMELLNEGGRGTLGHIAFYTPDMQRGIESLQTKGAEMDFDDVRKDAQGNIRLIYLKQEFEGFSIHLTTRKG